MLLKQVTLFVGLIGWSFGLQAQSHGSVTLILKPFVISKTNKELILRLEEYPIYQDANEQEKELLYWTNFARLFPKLFCENIVIPFIQSQPSTKGSNTASLIKELRKNKPLPFLVPDYRLTQAARFHSSDLANHPTFLSHDGSNGESYYDRMTRFNINGCSAENIAYGKKGVLQNLVLLYLDIGVPGLGHRKNLMNTSFSQIGVGIKEYWKTEEMVVMDFGGCE